ncbi:Mycothiol acetyltransferase [Isoptericola dokdonensis DS-3]|jgi:predicted GNAT family acetyltransferase|uniref:Mycothiol acetyltransferase n=2 Tax=Isoptericola TaxID=254250 RepID=A0A161IGD9_9MICO|nr:Mycothiol acetyltransferase [Isoptericola dokdonensis DS-3]
MLADQPDGGAARVLGATDLADARRVCASDPVASVLAAARVEVAARAGLAASGGQLWGYPRTGPVEAVCWAGANIVPVVPSSLGRAERDDAVASFAAAARRLGRRSSSVVGEQQVVLRLWELLSRVWPAPREIRADQPSLAIDRAPDVEPDPGVRLSRPDELDLVLPACVRMFTEEVGYSPLSGGGGAYAARVRGLIAENRSFVRLEPDDHDPVRVAFKAELGAVAGPVAQVQGVWVDPELRGRGLAAPGMAAVVELTRRQVAPVVSLYVNSFNAPALATYRRVGFEQVGTFATILF